ncbi:MAG: hypothetical protein HY654_00865 [Acidobacteria bacterium]|nr:hypothetical protein [Acidobacteriota bacterium]
MTDLERIRSIRVALEHLAAMLVTPNLEGLLESESRLRLLAGNLPSGRIDAGDRETAVHELAGAREALIRCRQLGVSLMEFVRLSFDARGETPGYGRRAGSMPWLRAFDARG